MSETLIYPNHPNFEPYRALARATELVVAYDTSHYRAPTASVVVHPERIHYEHVAVQDNTAFGHDACMIVPTAGGVSFWYENGGINTLSFYKIWPHGYVNEGRRIAAQLDSPRNDGAQAYEALAFGVGVLRPFRVEGKGFSSFLGETVRRVDSRQLRRIGICIVDMNSGWDGSNWTGGSSYALESTNLIMPDTFGELQQLHERKGEKTFMNAYLRDMQEATKYQPTVDGDLAPQCLNGVRPLWRAAHLTHINSGIWREAPTDVYELNDRVEELLGRIVVDEDPIEVTKTPQPSPQLLALKAGRTIKE